MNAGTGSTSGLAARRLAGFALAAVLSPLNSTMIAVALPAIGASFGATGATLTLWLVTSYLLASILSQSPAGKLSDVFGYSRVLTAGRLVFAAGALLGAYAPSVAMLAAARIAMAAGGSLNVPPIMAELRNQVAPAHRGRLFGIFGPRATTVSGSLLATAGSAMTFAVAAGRPPLLVAALAMLGTGIGFAMSPSQAAALSAVPREEAGTGAGALSTMRYLGGVLGSGLVALIVGSATPSPSLVWIFPLALAASAACALLLPSRP